METIIKNSYLIVDKMPADIFEKLEHGALQHRKFARITFKVIFATDDKITLEVRQDKSPAENYLDAQDLYQRAHDLFLPHLKPLGFKLNINTIPYTDSVVEIVTPEWIQRRMKRFGIKTKDLVKDTGVDKTNLSVWINGARPMSQAVKAMFYYYFELIRRNNEEKPDLELWIKVSDRRIALDVPIFIKLDDGSIHTAIYEYQLDTYHFYSLDREPKHQYHGRVVEWQPYNP
jgi:hypothetical protein